MNILVTNDDGIDAKGINVIFNKLKEYGHSVYMVAPAGNRSAVSSKISMFSSLEMKCTAENKWSCEGSPADCVIIACKNDASHNCIAAQLKEHSITRRYYAIVHGNLKEDEGVIDAPIGRDPNNRKRMAINHKNGKNAVTHYKVLERFGRFTWIECRLETGRTHQIRVHMASIGHPLLGDALYGPTKCPYQLQGQTLHAYVLGFIHPSTGEYMEFQAPLPDYFEDLLKKLRQSSAG